jgi:tellurite resistance-related uncharacterized protein
LTAEGRAARIGAEIDCPLCDRAELPEGLEVVGTAGPFDQRSMPAALSRAHRVAGGRWGRLRLIKGAADFSMQTDPPIARRLVAGQSQPIPPDVPHRVSPLGNVSLAVDFLLHPEQ